MVDLIDIFGVVGTSPWLLLSKANAADTTPQAIEAGE